MSLGYTVRTLLSTVGTGASIVTSNSRWTAARAPSPATARLPAGRTSPPNQPAEVAAIHNPSSGSIRYSDTWARLQYYHALFVQDDWLITPKLTLNLGLRLNIETGFTERYDRQAYFDPNIASPLAQAAGLPLKGGAVFSGVNGIPRQVWKTDWNNFGPRAGFAYPLTPKTVLRGAYRIFFLPTSQRGYSGTNPGLQVTTTFVSGIDGVTPVGAVSNPLPTGTLPLVGASLGASGSVGSSVGGLEYNTPMFYTQQWNFGVQRELPAGWLINVAYAGNQSVKLPLNLNPNSLRLQYYGTVGDQTQIVYPTQLAPNPFFNVIASGPLATATVQRQVLLRAFPQFTSVSQQYLGQANSVYDALQVTLQKRMSRRLSVLLRYTWSKNIGHANNLTTRFLEVGTPGYQSNYNRKLERSVVATDIPRRLVLRGNHELSAGKGKTFGSGMNRWLDAAVGGWQVNGILTLQSGFPMQFSNTGATAFAGSRPSFAGANANAYTSGGIKSRLGGVSAGAGYLNAAAFRQPPAFEFGDVPRMTDRFRTPGNGNVDFAVMKLFTIRESMKLQVRAEAFNALNHVIFSGPNASVGNASFGIVSSQDNKPRNIQLALRLLW